MMMLAGPYSWLWQSAPKRASIILCHLLVAVALVVGVGIERPATAVAAYSSLTTLTVYGYIPLLSLNTEYSHKRQMQKKE